MADLQLATITNHTESHINSTSTSLLTSDKIELLPSFDMPQNYSILINKLEQLALGLDSALGNFTIDRKEVEIALSGSSDDLAEDLLFGVGDPIAAGRAPPPHMSHGHGFNDDSEEYTHVVSDIWIGVILTLLIVFVIFFICACFLYHKFQAWKNSYRGNRTNEPVEICRRYPPDYEVESLPSYTIVSGLPSYDDALEEFRKAGIILTPSVVPIIKIFDSESKDSHFYNANDNGPADNNAADSISIGSAATCTCGATNALSNAVPATVPPPPAHNHSNINLGLTPYSVNTLTSPPAASQVIELSPDHLAALSQKRLSLQISFNNSVRQNSSSRTALRNNLLRSRAVGNTAGVGPIDTVLFPSIHRSSSAISLTNEQQILDQRLNHLHHRGSLY